MDRSEITLGPSFGTTGFTAEAFRQFDELYGAHEITSDFSSEIVAFLNGENSNETMCIDVVP